MIADNGEMSLDLTGRTTIGQFTPVSPGEQPWNLDTHGSSQPYCAPGTGKFTPFTTGISTALDCQNGGVQFEVTGSALVGSVAGGIYTGQGILVSAGNMGDSWFAFDGTPYSEIYHVTLSGSAVVPIPAAAWLFGSGLLLITGLARKKAGA